MVEAGGVVDAGGVSLVSETGVDSTVGGTVGVLELTLPWGEAVGGMLYCS